MKLDVPVLLMLSLVAATVQTSVPLSGWMVIKPPLLTAVAAYYATSRTLPLALTAALWTGALTDACSGLAFPVTPVLFMVLCGVLRYLRRYMNATVLWRGAIVVAAAAPIQAAWYCVVVGKSGLAWDDFLRGLMAAVGVGAIVGLVVFQMCGWFDRLAGNVKGAVSGDGIPWHNADI